MESKHTTGPWEVSIGKYQGLGEFAVYQGETGTICRGDDEMIDWEANAYLISAAPELLEACKEAILQIEYLHSKFKETGSGISVLLKLQTAIAKAESR